MHTFSAGVLDAPSSPPPPQWLIPSFIVNPRAPYTYHIAGLTLQICDDKHWHTSVWVKDVPGGQRSSI